MPYPIYPNNFQSPYQVQGNTGLIWVQGEAAAKSYLVAPNTTVALWDSENKIIYVKSADASGMPSMKVLEYNLRKPKTEAIHLDESSADYATKEDMNSIEQQILELRKKIDSIIQNGRGKELIEDE